MDMREEDFNKLLYYDESSESYLRWLDNKHSGIKPSGVAGSLDNTTGYYRVGVAGKLYYVHRIVWVLNKGSLLSGENIDHLDGNKVNNNISNLRKCSQSANMRNVRMNSNNTSGKTGVCFNGSSWVAAWRIPVGRLKIRSKTKTKSFSINKYGEEAAFELACEYRDKMIEYLNSKGRGYTERHGHEPSSTPCT